MIPSWAISPLISVVLGLLVAGGAWWQKSAYDERRREEGRAELLPQIEADKKAFQEISGYMQALKGDSTRIKDRLAKAEKLNGSRQIVERERVQEIDRVEPTGETECLRTTDAIQKVLR